MSIATDDFPSPDENSDNLEYNIISDSWSSKTNMPISLCGSCLCLATDGMLYLCGGQTGGVAETGASDVCYQYTPDSIYYLYGWGIKWA
jgi:hypothetical protein